MSVAAGDAPLALVPDPPEPTHTERHLRVVPIPRRPMHDHSWELRETDYDDSGLTVRRFECDCGGVSYR